MKCCRGPDEEPDDAGDGYGQRQGADCRAKKQPAPSAAGQKACEANHAHPMKPRQNVIMSAADSGYCFYRVLVVKNRPTPVGAFYRVNPVQFNSRGTARSISSCTVHTRFVNPLSTAGVVPSVICTRQKL